MVLGLLKWLKETIFYETKKEIIIKTWTLLERQVHIKKKGRVCEFSHEGKDYLSLVFTILAWYYKKWKGDAYWLLKSSCFELFRDVKYGHFLSHKVDGKVIFTDYWKVHVLNFSEMWSTVFFWAIKLIERWYLLITEKFMFWTFPRWEAQSFLEPKSWWKMIFTNYRKVIVLNFCWWEIPSFFQPKSWWKDDIYLVFLSFLWYSRTWKIWFFV